MTSWRGLWRRATLALARRGFFIPYRYADAVHAPALYPEIEPLFAAAVDRFRILLGEAAGYLDTFAGFDSMPPPSPRFAQDWFPRLDAAMAYAMVRIHMPRRIVEIGSGHSTRFLARAIADGGLATRLTAIDPAPRAALAGLAVDWFQGQVQDMPPKLMAGLTPGDVLFVDSSHVLMPGSDVDMILNRVMPMLPAGALVHLHDIFLPDGYPPAWSWRGYNEQSAVATLLTGGGYRLQWSSRYVATRMASEVRATGLGTLALPPGAHEASLWLEKL